jgi:hypothetical protein
MVFSHEPHLFTSTHLPNLFFVDAFWTFRAQVDELQADVGAAGILRLPGSLGEHHFKRRPRLALLVNRHMR